MKPKWYKSINWGCYALFSRAPSAKNAPCGLLGAFQVGNRWGYRYCLIEANKISLMI